jgi:regulator of protease activity HflC (stomatin/prohibitin superfamily)
MNLLLFVLMGLGAGLAVASLRRIPEDTVCTVHRFGRYVRTLTPGLRFTLPFVDHIAHRVRLVGHQVELRAAPAGEPATTCGALYYQILEPERAGRLLDDVDGWVEREASRHLAALAVSAPGQDGPMLGNLLKSELNQHLATHGLRITRCQLQRAA